MRKEDVPQDPGKLGKWRELAYAVNGDGRYTTIPSAGWEPKIIANDLAWEEIRKGVAKVLEEVHAGRKSPLAYHAARLQMNAAMLADYTGFARRQVRRHLEPAGFARLTPAELRAYSDLLEMEVSELCRVP